MQVFIRIILDGQWSFVLDTGVILKGKKDKESGHNQRNDCEESAGWRRELLLWGLDLSEEIKRFKAHLISNKLLPDN